MVKEGRKNSEGRKEGRKYGEGRKEGLVKDMVKERKEMVKEGRIWRRKGRKDMVKEGMI